VDPSPGPEIEVSQSLARRSHGARSAGDPREALVEAEQRIALLESRLALQRREQAELIHLVSHELRTPITVISGFARLLQGETEGRLGAAQHRYVDECLRACRRLDGFVADLLSAAPRSPRSLPLDLRRADLDETLRSLLESLSPLLEERGRRVETAWGGVRSVVLDVARIEQVVTNLITNALRHGREKGRIRLSTEVLGPRSRDGIAGSRVRVSVEDDGPGIPEADRERLFEPYVRGVGSESAGLGIGLTICRRIVAAHGGELRVDSSELGGACFTFLLPLAAAPPGEVAS